MKEKRIPKRENMLLNIGFNLILPILFLRKGSEWLGQPIGNQLGTSPESPLVGSIMLLIAISFPVGYGLWDLVKRKMEFYFHLGAVSALLTGGID